MASPIYSRFAVLIIAQLVLGACENTNLHTADKGTPSAPVNTVTEIHANENDEGLDEFERGARSLALTGDLDAMLERGYIRVLVPYNKTFFFYEGARPRGLAYEFMEAFCEKLRKGQQGKPIKLAMVYLPTPRDRLIPGIAEGIGDIAIAGLTVTDERQQIVEFVPNATRPVSEVIVTGPGAPRLKALEDLSGQKVFVRKSSSYYESLLKLNIRLRSAGKGEVKIVEADENLEVEDILELVRAGVEHITVADDFLARLWAGIMGDLDVHEDIVLSESVFVGPVVRKASPQLVAALGDFQKTHGMGTEFGNVVVNQYLKFNKWASNPSSSEDRKRFEKAIPLFEKYGRQYDLDIQLLVAQGYQESQLDQATRSRTGAVGVMQIKPSTAAGDPVNIRDVQGSMENNIHAGVRYLRHLMDDYFNDPTLTPFNRQLFAIAAYNAGPARINSLRQKAKRQGLDPNVWFDNVEIVSAKNIGRQNIDYVRNILKYWVAYRLAADFDAKP
jgi:membrane-bound lytic murein transglycosylase MltF